MSALGRVLGVAAKAAGLGVAVVGLSGYAAYRVVSWPLRKIMQSRPGAAVAPADRAHGQEPNVNPFVASMVLLAAPALVAMGAKYGRAMVENMRQAAEAGEEAMKATAESALRLELVVGSVSDLAEDRSPTTGERLLVLTFPVVDATTQTMLTSTAKCRITLDSNNKARRVHSFYERPSDGAVVDLYVMQRHDDDSPPNDDNDNSSGGGGRRVVLDAEVVQETPFKRST